MDTSSEVSIPSGVSIPSEVSELSEQSKAPPPERNPPKFSTTDTFVTLVVSSDSSESKFVIHKQFPCHYSPVLNAAFNSDFIEGKTQIYTFKETKHELVFALLVQWLYSQEINTLVGEQEFVDDSPDQTEEAKAGRIKDDDDALVKLWILADRLLIPECQNYVADRIMARFRHFKKLPFECISYVWDHTSGDENSLQCLFIILCFEARLSRDFLRDKECFFPKSLLMEIIGFSSSVLSKIYRSGEGVLARTYPSFYVPEPGRQRPDRRKRHQSAKFFNSCIALRPSSWNEIYHPSRQHMTDQFQESD